MGEGLPLARLSALRFTMTVTVLLVGIVFAAFLAVLMYLISLLWELPPLEMYGVAAVGAGFFVFVEYLIGPSVVCAGTDLRYLTSGENPWLEETVSKFVDKSGLPRPRLAFSLDETPNAFIFGRTAKSATLVVNEGLLRQSNEHEIEAVLGHELGHLNHRDYLVMTALAALPLIAYLIARVSFDAMRFGRFRGRGKGAALVWATVIVSAAVSYVAYLAAQLCVMRLSRLREHYADAYSAYLTGQPRDLESALTKIAYGLSLSPDPPHGARTLFISDPALAKKECQDILCNKEEYDLDRDGVLNEKELELAMEKEAKSTWMRINTLFATHPPTYKRVLLLREIENEMESGKFSIGLIYRHI
jgi:heat shock protein HtpX